MKLYNSAIRIVFFVLCSYAFNDHITLCNKNVIFSHGLGGRGENIYYYTKQNKWGNNNSCYHFVDDINVFIFDYEDNDQAKINLAQEADCTLLKKAHDYARTQKPNSNSLLFGVSRGGSAVLYYMGSKKPRDIDAIIVESPFANVEDVIAHYYLNVVPISCLRKWLACVITQYIVPTLVFKSYNPTGPRPLDYVDQIPQETALLLVCSKQDHVVPASSTIKLYKKLKQAGYHNLYLLILDQGEHANLLRGPEADKYQKTVHAFLKKNGYAHDPILAQEGEMFLADSQPSLNDL